MYKLYEVTYSYVSKWTGLYVNTNALVLDKSDKDAKYIIKTTNNKSRHMYRFKFFKVKLSKIKTIKGCKLDMA